MLCSCLRRISQKKNLFFRRFVSLLYDNNLYSLFIYNNIQKPSLGPCLILFAKEHKFISSHIFYLPPDSLVLFFFIYNSLLYIPSVTRTFCYIYSCNPTSPPFIKFLKDYFFYNIIIIRPIFVTSYYERSVPD